MPEAIINGFRMYYEDHGQGQPLVMIHGGLGGGEGCQNLMANHAAVLSVGYRVISYDRRAAGRSETPGYGYSIANYAQDLYSLLEYLKVDRAHILGSSAGGPIALKFVLEHPEMTQSLLLVNTMTYARESERAIRQQELDDMKRKEIDRGKAEAIAAYLEARWPGIERNDPERFAALKEKTLEQYDGILKTTQSYLEIRNSLESRLAEIQMPTMIVHGDADSRINVECGLQLHAGIAGSAMRTIPGAEHGLLTNEPWRTRNLILEFLTGAALQEPGKPPSPAPAAFSPAAGNIPMRTASIDHIAMPTANAERLLRFYKRLGFTINDEDDWRAGKVGIFSIQVGDSKINVHPEGYTATLRGPTAVPGCVDICFVWDGTAEECQELLTQAGVEVIRGPGPRKGARAGGALPAVSLYARDPDENLLEWMIYL